MTVLAKLVSVTAGESWWTTATHNQRVRLMRKMGFGDVQAYAGYGWFNFATHTRAEIDSIIETRNKRK